MTDMHGNQVTLGCTMRSCAAELDGFTRNPQAWSGRVIELDGESLRFDGDRHRIAARVIASCYEVVEG